ncbi:hypothetical protein KGA65_00695 [Ideonella sp. B7]|uniref:hypothetical protein n=1 Tax=Ideonella benzenivorans TaxID=2831643 RepID=UPI001CED6E86|nr:hypothetical protein [Ideonella benzenivorans]MCA6215049.1 hypothetical protein [Ideonella benzenivorans]
MARPDWRRHSPGWLLVVALHLGLWGLWQQALRPGAAKLQPTRPEPAPVWLLWPAAPAPMAAVPAIAPGKPPQPRATAPRRPVATQGIQAPRPAPATAGTLHAEAAARSEPVASSPPSPMTAASAAVPRGSLLDSEATRQALRDIARQPLLSERAASATGQTPHTAAQRVEQAVSKSAKSDCLRDPAVSKIGPLPLGGLLALPGLAVRALSGDCPR